MIGELTLGMIALIYVGGMLGYMGVTLLFSYLLSRSERLRRAARRRYYSESSPQKASRFAMSIVKTLVWPITIPMFIILVIVYGLIELYRRYCMLHNKFWQAEIFKDK